MLAADFLAAVAVVVDLARPDLMGVGIAEHDHIHHHESLAADHTVRHGYIITAAVTYIHMACMVVSVWAMDTVME